MKDEKFLTVISALIIVLALSASILYVKSIDVIALSKYQPKESKERYDVPTSTTLIVSGGDNYVFYTYNLSAGWKDWILLQESETSDSPAAVLVGKQLHIVIRGLDGRLRHGYIDGSDNGKGVFNGWRELSKSSLSAPSMTTDGKELILSIRDENNNTSYSYYDLKLQQGWNDWKVIPSSSTIDSPAATILAGNLHIVIRGLDGLSLHHNIMNLSTENFSGWQPISGLTRSAPTLTSSLELNKVVLAVRNLDNITAYKSWNGFEWNDWVSLESIITSDTPGATIIDNQLIVVVRDFEGKRLWEAHWSLENNQLIESREISGTALSKPTLINPIEIR